MKGKNMPDLWLNTPEGYPMAQKINKNDIGQLKSFLINITPDDELAQQIREATDSQIIKICEDNHFTFDEEWLGLRLLDWQK